MWGGVRRVRVGRMRGGMRRVRVGGWDGVKMLGGWSRYGCG